MDYVSARQNMVESQVRTNDVTDVQLQDAMRALHRERFVMPSRAALAYADRGAEYAPGRFLMAPRDVGKLLQAARPRTGERALAIGAPYAAALMARLGLEVTALDTSEALAHVRPALEGEGVSVRSGALEEIDGDYDVIVSEGGLTTVPDSWLRALRPQGRLAAVLRRGAAGKATLYVSAGDAFSGREVFDAFPPLLPGFEPRPSFVF